MEIKSAFCSSFLTDGHSFIVKQNVTLCPGHQHALTLDLGELECVNGDAAWKAVADLLASNWDHRNQNSPPQTVAPELGLYI